ncbi:hypothetical protein [Streptomyces hainanensis]|uniref:hypothetical protein n=1 Tax=Streptomyces hainanensis TaxID=402648 RepID=UPI001404BDD6|nr:hypothetical protein [Streptomyces hainanensis]
MSAFAEAARERIRAARARVAAAQEAGDVVGEAGAADELEEALRTAREHGVDPSDAG